MVPDVVAEHIGPFLVEVQSTSVQARVVINIAVVFNVPAPLMAKCTEGLLHHFTIVAVNAILNANVVMESVQKP